MTRTFFFISLLFLLTTNRVYSQQNPFSEVIGKEYSEYSQIVQAQYDRATLLDSAGREEIIKQFNDFAIDCDSDEIRLAAKLFESVLHFYGSREGGLNPRPHYSADNFIRDLYSIHEEAIKHGYREISARTLYDVAETYRIYLDDYDRAFVNYRTAEIELDKLSVFEFPQKLYYYLQIGNFYISFGDYSSAMNILEKVVNSTPSGWKHWYVLKGSLNGAGICQRELGNPERSDEYFRRILDLPQDADESDYLFDSFRALAHGGLGKNSLLRGDYKRAYQLINSSMETMANFGDYGYAADKAIYLAEIEIIWGKTGNANSLLSLSKRYKRMADNKNPSSNLSYNKEYYRVKAKYYSAIKNSQKTSLYIDSLLQAERSYNEYFNTKKLFHLEQQMRNTEKIVHDENIRYEKQQKSYYRKIFIICFVASAILLVLAVSLIILYRKKRSAYTELVRKAEQWALNDKIERPYSIRLRQESNSEEGPAREITDEDYKLIDSIHTLIIKKNLYRDSNMTPEVMSERLKLDRGYLTKTIYRVTGKNFAQFIDDYRIKEAIKSMYNEKEALSLDQLSNKLGFLSRPAFFIAFKNATGLSPSEFRNNVKKGL